MAEEFQKLLTECIRESFKNQLNEVDEKKNAFALKAIELKKLIYEKSILLNCNSEINELKNFGEINIENGELKLTDVDDEKMDDAIIKVESFNKCYNKHSFGINDLSDQFSSEIDNISDVFMNDLSQCNSNDRDTAKSCLNNTIRNTLKSFTRVCNKYNPILDKIKNKLI